MARDLSQDEQEKLRLRIRKHALRNGMYQIDLGLDGVKPTYLITVKMLGKILGRKREDGA